MPEQLRLDERGGQGRQVQGDEQLGRPGHEAPGRWIKRDEARHPDGPGDKFLASAGWAHDQGRDVRHAPVECTHVASHVVGEDGLPDRRPQSAAGIEPADDPAEDMRERPLDLVEAGKDD